MKETFRYNSVLLPEYVSTIAISMVTTLIVASDKKIWPTHGNPHYAVALALYGVLALLLVWLTLHARWRWCVITIEDETVRGSLFGLERFRIRFLDVESIQERIGKFFGRRARRLTIRSFRHDPVEIADFIYDYERLKRLLGERWGRAVEQVGGTPEQWEQLRERALKRKRVFGWPRPWRILLLIPVRAVGLMPVLFVDLFFTLFIVFGFHGDPKGGDPRAVYAAPIALAAAALTARCVYYRLSSSIRLNRVVRFRWGRGAGVKA